MSTKAPILLLLVLFLLLLPRLLFYKEKTYNSGDVISIEERLLTQPKTSGKTQQFFLSNILIITTRFPQYSYGETLRVSGTLEQRVIGKNRPILVLSFPKIESIQKEGGGFLAVLFSLRQRIMSFFFSNLPETSAALLGGILLGGKAQMPKEFLDALKTSGTLHIIAASGMNVTMVASFLVGTLGLLFKRQVGLFIAIVGIFLYAALAGFEPSIVRASLMATFFILAQILGRQTLPLFYLLLTGFLMLFVNPKLLWDIGFQLSFLATIGILTLKPRLDSIWPSKRLRFFREQLTITFAAQLFTLPILLGNFGTFSLFSIVANLSVLWTIPALMIIGALSASLSLFLPVIARLLAFLAFPYLIFFEAAVRFFGRLPSISFGDFPLLLGIGYYLILISLFLASQVFDPEAQTRRGDPLRRREEKR